MRKSKADQPSAQRDDASPANRHILDHLRCARLIAEQQQMKLTTYLIDMALASRAPKRRTKRGA
jgi:hypothetical protein